MTGVGTAQVPADRFRSIWESSTSAQLEQAQNDVTKSMSDVLTCASRTRTRGVSGFPDIPIRHLPTVATKDSGRNQQANQKPREIIGYEVSTNILVRTTQMDKAAKIIESAVSAGANDVGQIPFTSSDPRTGRSEAIKKAARMRWKTPAHWHPPRSRGLFAFSISASTMQALNRNP